MLSYLDAIFIIQFIFFNLGGIYPATPFDNTGTTYYYGHVNMSDILMYDTIQATWKTDVTTGSVLPAPRMDHTLTMSKYHPT